MPIATVTDGATADSTLTWIIVGLAVLALVVIAVILLRKRSSAQHEVHRAEAQELREEAMADQVEVQRREAAAARIDAEARLAQAEADAKSAEAAAMQRTARERSEEVAEARADVDHRLRRADELDPDGARARDAATRPEATDHEPGRQDHTPDHVAHDRSADRPDGRPGEHRA